MARVNVTISYEGHKTLSLDPEEFAGMTTSEIERALLEMLHLGHNETANSTDVMCAEMRLAGK